MALGDVEGGEEGSPCKQDDGTYVINGEVTETLGDCSVTLREQRHRPLRHANLIDVGEQATSTLTWSLMLQKVIDTPLGVPPGWRFLTAGPAR